jgi:hypothetical protein
MPSAYGAFPLFGGMGLLFLLVRKMTGNEALRRGRNLLIYHRV